MNDRSVSVLYILGGVLSLAGWTDVLLFYWPSHFGDSQWEFGTIARTIDALPAPTLGAGLLTLALVSGERPQPRVLRSAMIVLWIVAGALAALLILFVLDIAVAMGAMRRALVATGTPQAANPLAIAALQRGIGKALLLGMGYLGTYALLGWQLRSAARTTRRTTKAAPAIGSSS